MRPILSFLFGVLFLSGSAFADMEARGRITFTKPIFDDGLSDYPAQAGGGIELAFGSGSGELTATVERVNWKRVQAKAGTVANSDETLLPIFMGYNFIFGGEQTKFYAGGELGTILNQSAISITGSGTNVSIADNSYRLGFSLRTGFRYILAKDVSMGVEYKLMAQSRYTFEEAANAGANAVRNESSFLQYHVVALYAGIRF